MNKLRIIIWKLNRWITKTILSYFSDYRLEQTLVDRGHAVAMWSYHDVVGYAVGKEPAIIIPDFIAKEIIYEVHHNHDCNHGITWDTLDYYIWRFEEEKLKELAA